MNHNYKPGDKVELNCSVGEFCENVGLGDKIYKNCFADGIGIVESVDDEEGIYLVGSIWSGDFTYITDDELKLHKTTRGERNAK